MESIKPENGKTGAENQIQVKGIIAFPSINVAKVPKY